MKSTFSLPGSCSETNSQSNTGPVEIHVRRDVVESSLYSFYKQVNAIRNRQETLFETLARLLPQLLAAMVRKELLSQTRAVTLRILERLSVSEGGIHCLKAHNADLSDAGLVLWLAEQLPRSWGHTRDLFEDYFEELLQSMRDIEAARFALFGALEIPLIERHRDLAWIRGVKLPIYSFPVLNWHATVACRLCLLIPWLRRYALRRCERDISTTIASYCDQLIAITDQAACDWLSDIQWRVDQELSEQTDQWVVSAEIVTLLQDQWRGLPSPSEKSEYFLGEKPEPIPEDRLAVSG